LIAKRRLHLVRALAVAVSGFPLASVLGVAPGVLLLTAALVWASGALLAICLVLGTLLVLVGLLLGLVAALVRRLTRAVPDNYFGVCSGYSAPESSPAALTPWLADQLDRFAGVEGPLEEQPPLTFGDLWRGPDPASAPVAGE